MWFEDEESCMFPLFNLSGQITGYQRYRPYASKEKKNDPREGRYFTWRNKNVISLWGLESWNLSNTLFVTEGIFDASRLTWNGYSAIALLSNDPSNDLKRWLWTVRKSRFVVAVCDNDSAGKKLAKAGHVSHIMTDKKDMGDATDQYVKDFLKKYN